MDSSGQEIRCFAFRSFSLTSQRGLFTFWKKIDYPTKFGYNHKPIHYSTMDETEAIDMPIDGILDLHTFNPRDVKSLVPEYIRVCRERNILQVRIIHGKGTGTLLRTVHAILERLPEVVSFRLAHEDRSGWGATLVELAAQQ
ncbi:MAG: Smr/MutS family protein [Desulfobulbaceae bacterium]|nr:Smr/MutS family protein [Desulfobulbaceae bacterium]